MGQYFAGDYPGPAFQLLGPAHLAALGTFLLLNLGLIRTRHASENVHRTIRWTLAILIWSAEIAWHVWNLGTGQWSPRFMLPLNLCSILIWLTGFMLIFKNQRIYEFVYFLGIGGGIQYLLTPDLGIYGFPHFRFFQTFLSHGLLVTAPIYMTAVEGFRPTRKSVVRVVIWANIYMAAVFLVNLRLGSDYLMLNAKPATPSLLDLLPPWPSYIIFMELIGLATIWLLYLPFLIKDSNTARN